MRWRPYVPARQRKANGLAQAQRELGKGKTLQPIRVEGRKIAKSFWGSSWCEHFETYSDYANRLPRGRTYARNGSIVHLEISSGMITAMVAGSDLYHIKIKIDTMPVKAWKRLCGQCTSSVTSAIDLLRGKLPEPVLATLTDPDNDLFPRSKEIHLSCDCPDWAGLCKHLAAVLYGVGNRLDDAPDLLFLLRGVNQNELIGSSLAKATESNTSLDGAELLNEQSGLDDIFGIDLVDSPESAAQSNSKPASKATKKAKTKKTKTARKKAAFRPANKTTRKKTKKKAKLKISVKKKAAAKNPAKKKTTTKKTASRKTSSKKPAVKKKTRAKKQERSTKRTPQ